MSLKIGSLIISQEELDSDGTLEVDKVNTDQGADDEFDTLLKDVKLKTEMDEKEKSSEDEEGEGSDDETTEPDTTEVEGKEAIEALSAMHDDCLNMYHDTTFFSFAQEDFLDSAKDGLIYLKDIGVHYTPIVGKHLFNASMFALNKAVKALSYGTAALATYVKQRLESFNRTKSKLQKAKAAIALLDTTKVTEATFKKPETIARLLASNESNSLETAMADYAAFLHTGFNQIEANAKMSLAVTARLVSNVTAGISQLPTMLKTELPLGSGFEKKEVVGYAPTTDVIESYCYKDKLPGNMYFIAQLPKPEVDSLDELKEAYRAASMFFGIDTQSSIDLDEIPYLDIKGLKAFIATLEAICDEAIKHEAAYKSIEQGKEHLKLSLRGLGSFIMKRQVNSDTVEGLSEIVSIRTAHVDKIYMAGYMAIHNYTVKVLSASLTYVKANITALSQVE